MTVSPLCLQPLLDANGNEIREGQTIELKPGSRPYRRLHKVERHQAGFLRFVREDCGYVYHARKTASGNYRSDGTFPSRNWLIVAA